VRLSSFKLRNVVIPVGCLGVMVYFAYHAVHGDHGLYASWGLQTRVEALRAERDGLVAVRNDLEHKVGLMRPESIDPDMLDEQARATLNLAHPNDIIIFRDPQS
jgi:cell division protein FtsB